MWRQLHPGGEPLRARLAVVQPLGPEGARVKFFTYGAREHPSAPLTGLAILALAAGPLGWFDPRATGQVLTPLGPMALPRTHAVGPGLARIDFPPVLVDLQPALDGPS